MEADSKKKYLRWMGYSFILMCVFGFFIYQAFPYELLIQRLTDPLQRRAKMQLRIGRVTPHWISGVQARNINVRQLVKKGTAEVQIDKVTLHLSLFSLLTGTLRATFDALLARGRIKGFVSKKGKWVKAKLNIEELQLAALGPSSQTLRMNKQAKPLIKMLFAPIYGRLRSDISVTIPLPGAKSPKKAKPKKSKKKKKTKRKKKSRRKRRKKRKRRYNRRSRRIDIKKLSGNFKINIRGLSIGPGYFPTGNFGEVPVPQLRLGTFMLKLKVEKGRAKIIKCVAIGADGEIHITGSIQLRSRLNYSVFKGKVKFKINKAFVNRPSTPSLLKGALQMLGPAKSNGYHTYKVYMPFRGRPRFRKM